MRLAIELWIMPNTVVSGLAFVFSGKLFRRTRLFAGC
jgi:hypothetical protein